MTPRKFTPKKLQFSRPKASNAPQIVTAIQWRMDAASLEQYKSKVTSMVDEATERGSRLIVFPEYFFAGLTVPTAKASFSAKSFIKPCQELVAHAAALAKKCNCYILLGTVFEQEDSHIYNAAPFCLPNGKVHFQRKINLTPWELGLNCLASGSSLKVFATDFGKVAIAICYDIEFPMLVDQLAHYDIDILLNPSCTDSREGFWRVRHCAHARAIEHQIYVINAATVGWCAEIPWLRAHEGQAAILTPCDDLFSSQGIARTGDYNAPDQLVVAPIDLNSLAYTRRHGSVRPREQKRTNLKVETV
jgi:predicted amidohydrolase